MSGWISSTGWNINLAAPGPIGGTTPSSGSFTTLNASTNAGIGSPSPGEKLYVNGTTNVVRFNSSVSDYNLLVFSIAGTNYYAQGVGTGGEVIINAINASGQYQWQVNSNTKLTLDSAGNLTVAAVVSTAGYTVATLPSGVPTGSRAYVTDALTPTSLTAVVGGGAVVVPVFYNGSAWIVG